MTILAAFKTVTDSVTVGLSSSGSTDIVFPVAITSNCRVLAASFSTGAVQGVALTGSYLNTSTGNWVMEFRAPATTDPSVTIEATLTVISVE